jgi:NADPH2:quinone reductase
MGNEAAGIVRKVGIGVTQFKQGDLVFGIASSGSFADYTLIDSHLAIPIPDGISFAEANSIPVQGLTAHALVTLVCSSISGKTVLIQAAAGGVGVYLVQLAKLFNARVIALASTEKKLKVAKELGADAVINYSEENWEKKVLSETDGHGIDVVFERTSGSIGAKNFELMAPSGQIVLFGSDNTADTFDSDQVAQIIHKNLSVTGFNLPAVLPMVLTQSLPSLIELITTGKLRLFADFVFPLEKYKEAFTALNSRNTIGKVVLVP